MDGCQAVVQMRDAWSGRAWGALMSSLSREVSPWRLWSGIARFRDSSHTWSNWPKSVTSFLCCVILQWMRLWLHGVHQPCSKIRRVCPVIQYESVNVPLQYAKTVFAVLSLVKAHDRIVVMFYLLCFLLLLSSVIAKRNCTELIELFTKPQVCVTVPCHAFYCNVIRLGCDHCVLDDWLLQVGSAMHAHLTCSGMSQG